MNVPALPVQALSVVGDVYGLLAFRHDAIAQRRERVGAPAGAVALQCIRTVSRNSSMRSRDCWTRADSFGTSSTGSYSASALAVIRNDSSSLSR